nr:MAG TPA: hypothetical protein [Bacteriophage sp.]
MWFASASFWTSRKSTAPHPFFTCLRGSSYRLREDAARPGLRR